ncbi:hypothetical protein [Lactiplantibacillus modestisalitolerans]|uniref:Uncharacterized protein n=1 Tax=Lactiplantibacillus modestisalitolerans TaxID=1457219 RepID=A0ABV5WVE1_9LACO|nr:hypothetical protein [Lactiplantibacillus modestisalitolerans]
MIVIPDAIAYPILSATITWLVTFGWIKRRELFGDDEEVSHDKKNRRS